MIHFYSIIVHGHITDGVHVMACPTCNAQTGIAISGRLGQPAGLECPRGHRFTAGPPFDGVELLRQVVAYDDLTITGTVQLSN